MMGYGFAKFFVYLLINRVLKEANKLLLLNKHLTGRPSSVKITAFQIDGIFLSIFEVWIVKEMKNKIKNNF
jgi:hypothetical protein